MALTAERLREVLEYKPETGEFIRRTKTGKKGNVGSAVGWKIADGRWMISVDGIKMRRSVAAWLYVNGAIPKNDIDHVNRDPSDDRLQNLREATRQQNMANKTIHKNNSCGFKGVHLHKQTGKWRATVRFNRKNKHIGLFSTKEEAHQAYVEEASRLFGEFSSSGKLIEKGA